MPASVSSARPAGAGVGIPALAAWNRLVVAEVGR